MSLKSLIVNDPKKAAKATKEYQDAMAEQNFQRKRVITFKVKNTRDHRINRLRCICERFEEMDYYERMATIGYINSMYDPRK